MKLKQLSFAFISILFFNSQILAQNAPEAERPRAYLKVASALNPQDVQEWDASVDLAKFYDEVRTKRLIPWKAPDGSNFPRRITWQYAEEGCEMRAELVNDYLQKINGQRMQKIFIVDPVKFVTPFDRSGESLWFFHVAPVTRIGNEIYVIDLLADMKKPVTVKQWLSGMQHIFATPETAKVAICDENAMSAVSYCQGGPEPDSRDLKVLLDDYLKLEWESQTWEGKNPYLTLGDQSPLLDF